MNYLAMVDFTKYSDKNIRNNTDTSDEVELAFIDMEAAKAVDGILSRYHGEPAFQRRIAVQLAERVLKND
jgi:hypothetical protein